MRLLGTVDFSHRVAAALLGGALLPFSLAPWNFALVGIASAALFAASLWQLDNKKSVFLLAFLFGSSMYAVGVSWVFTSIYRYGETGLPLALILTTLFVVLLGLIFALPWVLLNRLDTDRWFALSFAVIWFLGEWMRSWFLTGFPWISLGVSQMGSLGQGWLPMIGAMGTGALLSFFAASVVLLLARRDLFAWVGAVSGALILLAGLPLSGVQWTEPVGQRVRVGLVQPAIPLEDKWNASKIQQNLDTLMQLSHPLWREDIVIWPEAALPTANIGQQTLLENLHHQAEETHTALLTGRLIYDPQVRRYFNSVVGVGYAKGNYNKRHLVPFGEYVPFENQLRGLITLFDLPMSVLSSGAPEQQNLRALSYEVAVAICYEIAYPAAVAASAQDAHFILTVSNDTWFADSIGPLQHFQLAQVRAIENAKPVLRGTNNGLTGVINHQGVATALAPQFSPERLRTSFIPMQGNTPYSAWQNRPMLALSLVACGLLVWRKRKTERLL